MPYPHLKALVLATITKLVQFLSKLLVRSNISSAAWKPLQKIAATVNEWTAVIQK